MALRAAPLVFPAATIHTATVIFCHGLGDTGRGWASAVENWRRRGKLDEVKFVLPNAEIVPITCNMGMRMPGWFDIKVLDGSVESLREHDDREGVLKSRDYLYSLIDDEAAAGISADRVVLGGFSQGGAMAFAAGLTAKQKLAGIVGLSSWLPLSKIFRELVPAENANAVTKVLMCHGDEDPLVRTKLGKISAAMLKEWGYDVELKLYEGLGHSACLEELDDVEAFLSQQLPSVKEESSQGTGQDG